MALQVWLPLNGDIKNQGLSNFNIVTNNVTFVNTGKIGQCANFNGSNSYIYINNINLGDNWSYGCWINTPISDSRGWEIVIILNNTGSDADSQLAFWVHQKENRFETLANTQYNSTISYAAYYGTWHHFFATFNGNVLTTYMDGIIVNTKTITAAQYTGTNLTIGARCTGANGSSFGNYFQGQLNDVRIYDHCLSDKEVEEIAKGLVLHYKLDDTYAENSTIISCNITETAYNSPISKYGYNDTSNLIKTTGNFQGKNCVKIGTRVAGQQACPYAYFGNLFTSNGTNAPAYKALSFDYYTTVPTTTWLNIYKLGSGQGTATWKTINSDGIHSGTYTNSANSIIVKPNEWNHVEVIFHGTTDANAEWGYCINGTNHVSSEEYYFLYANIQLEENNHVTGYGENMHSNIIYDSSGYNNNGNIIGDLTIDISNSRYSYSTIFNGTSRIMANSLPAETKTLTCWAKTTKNKSTSQQIVADSNSALTISFYQGTIIGVFGTTRSTGSKSTLGSEYKENDWNFFAVVKTSEDGKRDIYCNGIKLTPTSNDYWGAATGFFIGARNASQGNPFYGEISDVRAYVTALTAEQILELYNTSATIDNKGNIYAREVVE